MNIYGGEMPTYEVRIGTEALLRYGISVSQVFNAIANNNAAKGGAYIERNDQQEVIRGEGFAESPRDITSIVLTTGPDGTPITIGTLGEVVEAPKVRIGAVSHDGKGETVVGIALMHYGQNASQVIEAVKQSVARIQKQLPPGVEISPYYDRSALVTRTINTVEHNLLEGAALVIVVLLLVLGRLRAGLIVASAIPFSMLMAFVGMRQFGISGNLMSLGAIDFGLIVDGAVVMVENVLRSRAANPKSDPLAVTAKAAAEVARPVAFAVLIIVIVYLPILTLESVEGKMFRPMALTVILALVSSLALTMTVIPSLAAIFLSGRSAASEKDTPLMRYARRGYTPILDWSERRPVLVGSIAVLSFAGAVVLAIGLGSEFIPTLEEGAIVVTSEKLPGISLDASLRTVNTIEKVLKGFPDVDHVVSLTGSAAIPTDPMGVESTNSFISLKPTSEWKTAKTQNGLVSAFEKRLKEEVPGVAFTFSQPIQMRMQDLLQGARGDVVVSIYGDDLSVLRQKAEEVAGAISNVQGAADTKPEALAGYPSLIIKVNRVAVARYGMNVSDVLNVVESIGGHTASTVYGRNNSQTEIVFRLPPNDRTNVEEIRNLPVSNAQGRMIPLSELADVAFTTGPAEINRQKLNGGLRL